MADLADYKMPDKAPEPDAPMEAGLPASVDAERTILGAILLDNESFNDAAELLEADDLSLDSHCRIFLRMSELVEAGRAVDIVTLADILAQNKEIEAVGGVAYLASLTEGLPLRPVIDEYIRIVKDKSRLRQMMGICSQVITRAADQSETALTILEDAESRLLEIAQDAVQGKLRTVAESVEKAGGVDEYLAPIVNPSVQMGMPTGFYDVDRLTGGLKGGNLIIVAARPSMGKTAYGINIATNCALDEGALVAFFSLEMTRDALEKRMLASIGRVDVRRAMAGEFLSSTEKEKLQNALGKLVEANLFVDDTAALTPTQMRAKARRLKQRHGRLDLVVIDYLQLMTVGHKTESRRVEVEIVSRSLKAMAKELNAPVIALAQVSRQSEQRSDRRPVLADLRESGGIEQDADIVQFIHRPEYYDRENEDLKGLAEIIVAKNREGPTDVVKLGYLAEMTAFTNLARGR